MAQEKQTESKPTIEEYAEALNERILALENLIRNHKHDHHDGSAMFK